MFNKTFKKMIQCNKNKKTVIILILINILTASNLYAEEPSDIFLYFLFALAERHQELQTLTMPEVEFLTVPGMDEAANLIIFNTAEDARIFLNAVNSENISNGTFPNDDRRILLFRSDMLRFIVKVISE